MADGRLAGMIDWKHLVDRTRHLRGVGSDERPTWDSPEQIMNAVVPSYRTDKWAKQPFRAEVWIEKDALVGVIENVCNELQVPFFSCRGYVSISEMWSAAMRLRKYVDNDQQVVIFHLGDHDPSGMQMTEDIRNRLNEVFGTEVDVRRIALNMDQVTLYNPPPNPAKETDARYRKYADEFGDECYELDALEPVAMTDLIREHVEGVRDDDLWDESIAEETRERWALSAISEHWDETVEFLEREWPRDEHEGDEEEDDA